MPATTATIKSPVILDPDFEVAVGDEVDVKVYSFRDRISRHVVVKITATQVVLDNGWRFTFDGKARGTMTARLMPVTDTPEGC